ncbi:hypothetical protein BC833DRAFT_606648 [Globomyces pollinis-pini]|nr:hypothetical protein BC833DRAFT_606648 [Globomyces pollinis-pini]
MTVSNLEFCKDILIQIQNDKRHSISVAEGKQVIASQPFVLTSKTTQLLQLQIKPLKEFQPFNVESDSLDPIAWLKLKCANQLKLQPDSVSLLYNGKSLLDSRCLLDYGIEKSITLHLSIKNIGSNAISIDPIIPNVPTVKKESTVRVLDEQIFWSQIKSILDSKFNSDESEKILAEWKLIVEKRNH